MEYTIGEVSSLLNLSRDMIRYYEKQGAIRANRNSENRYRSYDTMELFWLLEAMAHKSWGLPIGEIQGIRQEQYARNTQAFLEEEIEKLERETRFKVLLTERLKQVRDYTALSAVNIGNFWVQRVPACFCCHLVTGRGDEYGQITLSEALSRFVFSERMLPFFDSGFTLNGDRVDWQMRIEESWLRKLSDQLPEGFERYDEPFVSAPTWTSGRWETSTPPSSRPSVAMQRNGVMQQKRVRPSGAFSWAGAMKTAASAGLSATFFPLRSRRASNLGRVPGFFPGNPAPVCHSLQIIRMDGPCRIPARPAIFLP